MANQNTSAQPVRGPGAPDQNNLVPNKLQTAQKGPSFAYSVAPPGTGVTDILPTAAPVVMQTKAR